MWTFATRTRASRSSGGIIVRLLRPPTLFFAAFLPLFVSSCGSTAPTGPRPKPALSNDSLAQVRFRELSDQWHSASPEQRQKLEPAFRAYLREFPYDEPRRLAWIYLAWILVQKGELTEASELIDRVRSGPEGTVNDFAVVTQAARLHQLGQHQEALELLRPLRGKLIDPVERFLLTEQLVFAALGSELTTEAISYMVDWSVQAPVTQRRSVHEAIESHLHQTPKKYLQRALIQLEPNEDSESQTDSLRLEEQAWLHEAIARRLTALAVADADSDLAQFVLDRGSGLGETPEAAEELLRLATASERTVQVNGRTLGLILATKSPQQRRRSSEVASAVAVALGLPKSAARPGATRVVFAEDSGGPRGATEAFQNLSLQGVSLVIAGVDSQTAQHHSWQAELSGLPTLLLYPHELEHPEFSFTLGVSREMQVKLLEGELSARGFVSTRLLDAQNDLCGPEAKRGMASDLRDWYKSGTDSVIFVGALSCAEAFSFANREAGRQLMFGFGLEGAPVASSTTERAIALSVGLFPLQVGHAALGEWIERNGKQPSWYESLGRDASVIAQTVLSGLPEVHSSDRGAVHEFHNQVRAALRRFRGTSLWTSQAATFDSNLVLDHRFDFVGEAEPETSASP